MSNRKPNGYWTLERCMEDASEYASRGDWKRSSRSAYAIAQKNGWLPDCVSHMGQPLVERNKWTKAECQKDALRFTSRAQWIKGSQSSYVVAQANGWLSECTQHMELLIDHSKWTKASVISNALLFKTKADWRKHASGAFNAAKRLGVFEDATSHMPAGYGSTSNDVVYIWRNSGTDLHKVGVTSERLGEQRIDICKRHNDMDPRIVFMLRVADARAVESELLKLGTDPELDSSIDGYTEFRKLTNTELGQAVSIAYEAAIAA